MPKSAKSAPKNSYRLDENGCFIIQDYNHCKPFSNFFPGVAGEWGIPMWVFYVNRGQGISSFGIESKDKAVLEFQPANKAYRLTSLQGFRTFIKIKSGPKTTLWEPFQGGPSSRQTMFINAHDLTIQDVNPGLGLTVHVNYFTMPGEPFSALVRHVTVINTSRKKQTIEMLDGLPLILPYGMKDWLSKNMSRTVEAWVKVKNVKQRAPFYHLNVEVSDTPEVTHIREGNFYMAFDLRQVKPNLLDCIVEPEVVFGQATDFLSPQRFLGEKKFAVPAVQQTSNRTPSAFSYASFSLQPMRTKEVVSLIGYTHSEAEINRLVKKITAKGFIARKARENKQLVERIKHYAFTHSSSPAFDLYCGQTFLDNVLRGGLPVSLQTKDGQVAFNVFSRKHGDPERDYNYFLLSPTYLSQGNGNYRDVNQNRRNDVWFNESVKDCAVVDFFSLGQADGYNPLIVKGMSFYIDDSAKAQMLIHDCVKEKGELVKEMLFNGFQPGELLKLIEQKEIPLKVSLQEFLSRAIGSSHKRQLADHGEGFWSDHWTYNIDLLESYLSVYPEDLKGLLLERKQFSFYFNHHHVLPRDQRYLLVNGKVRQYHSVADGGRPHGQGMSRLRTRHGQGEIYHSTLIGKFLCVIANKAATLDPSGTGIEMEADRPSWYDALNGLPGLLGSSVSETFELKRYSRFLLHALEDLRATGDIEVFSELAGFIRELAEEMRIEREPAAYWHEANAIKERYRAAILTGIDGKEEPLSVELITEFLKLVIARCDKGIEKAKDSDGLLRTYFTHEVVDYALLDKKKGEHSYVLPVAFKRHALPLFLEGFVHALRVEESREQARQMYQAVKKSPLFDRKLKMYKVNADLSGQSEEIGRTRIFPRGWLENESIWLHMEYKYLLELLRSGLFEEYEETFRQVLIPFLNPETYGRSTLENSSFLVSSAHEDVSLHGRGFVARLSGSTAEFIHIWLIMNAGRRPFRLNEQGRMCLVLEPALPGWLFTQKSARVEYTGAAGQTHALTLPANTYSFVLLASALTVYHNPRRCNTFGPQAPPIKEITLTLSSASKPVVIKGGVIPEEYARQIRDRKAQRIDVYFA